MLLLFYSSSWSDVVSDFIHSSRNFLVALTLITFSYAVIQLHFDYSKNAPKFQFILSNKCQKMT